MKSLYSSGFLPHLLGIILPEFGSQILRVVENAEHTKLGFIEDSADSKLGNPSNLKCSLANPVWIMPSRGDKKEAIHWLFNESPR